MRRITSRIIGLCLMGGGLYMLYLQVFHSTVIYGWMLMFAAIIVVAGYATFTDN